MKVIAIIEKNKDGFYSVYVPEELPGIALNGQGFSVEEAKDEMFTALREYKEILQEEGEPVPEDLENLQFEYRYDLESFFNYFDWINVSKLAEKAGINSSLLRQYKNGITTASEKQKAKIEECLKQLANELQTVRF